MRRAGVLVVVAALSCGGDAGDSSAPIPEVAGRYQVFVTTISGCDNDVSLIQPWAQGPLAVTQDGGTLSLDYGEDAVLTGSVGVDGEFSVDGELAWAGAQMDLSQDGVFAVNGADVELAARFRNVVSVDEFESNNCTLEADIEATRISE